MPEVSVIIPAYNAGRTIDAALQSVFAQTFKSFEVIVVDDGSTDDTSARIALWGDRVRCLRQANSGPAHARNQAFRVSSGGLLAFLDADDMWLPRKLDRQVAYFRQFPSAGLVHTATLVSASPMRTMGEVPDASPLDATGEPPSMQFGALFHDRHINTLTVMVPRDVLTDVGGFDERRELDVDWDLWLRIAARFPIGALPMPLAIRRSVGGMSSAIEKTFRGQQLVIEKNARLAELTCERHAGRSRACIESRLYHLDWEQGYMRFWRGDMRGARAAFLRAARLRPLAPHAWAYAAASWTGKAWVEPVRRFRHTWARTEPGAAPDGRRAETSSLGLVQATACHRARRVVTRVAHGLDDVVSLAARRRVRVLFEAASPMSLAVFQPVLDRLEGDPRLEFWFTTSDQRWTSAAIFGRDGRSARVISPADARWMKFDGYINTDFWNTTWPRRCTTRIHLFHGVAGKYGLDTPIGIGPVLSAFDRLMFPNRDRLQRYAEAGLVDPDSARAALVGYPKVDCLVDGSLDRRTIERELGLDPGLPTILYAPTWSAYSSLAAIGEEVVDALSRLDVNVVVKLHDRSVDPSERCAGSLDWHARLSARGPKGRVHVATGPNASPYMFAADAIVTDHSSVGFEYMLLDRPIVVIDCPQLVEHARINTQKVDLLRSAADLATNATELVAAIERALAHPHIHSERRTTIANELFYCAGTATTRAAACIYDALSLAAPEPQLAALPAESGRRPIPDLVRIT